MNHDVFLSILSMDPYDRGVIPGVNGLANTGSIGGATIQRISNITVGSPEITAGKIRGHGVIEVATLLPGTESP